MMRIVINECNPVDFSHNLKPAAGSLEFCQRLSDYFRINTGNQCGSGSSHTILQVMNTRHANIQRENFSFEMQRFLSAK